LHCSVTMVHMQALHSMRMCGYCRTYNRGLRYRTPTCLRVLSHCRSPQQCPEKRTQLPLHLRRKSCTHGLSHSAPTHFWTHQQRQQHPVAWRHHLRHLRRQFKRWQSHPKRLFTTCGANSKGESSRPPTGPHATGAGSHITHVRVGSGTAARHQGSPPRALQTYRQAIH
jgi:hypothetical protein